MNIEYQISRYDLVKVYFYNLFHSGRTQLIVFGFSALTIVMTLAFRISGKYKITGFDILVAVINGLAICLIVMPLVFFITAKTQKRSLRITSEGIDTTIGLQAGTVQWSQVLTIIETNDFLIITGKSGNAFSIPHSAFANPETQKRFASLAKDYHSLYSNRNNTK